MEKLPKYSANNMYEFYFLINKDLKQSVNNWKIKWSNNNSAAEDILCTLDLNEILFYPYCDVILYATDGIKTTNISTGKL